MTRSDTHTGLAGSASADTSSTRRLVAFGIVAAVISTLAATWPVVLHLPDHVVDGGGYIPSGLGPTAEWARANFSADVLQTVWIANWNLHALATQPLDLFQANIAFPTSVPLARADHMLATSLLALPGRLVGGPVFAHQTALLLCGVINFLACAWLVLRWTGSRAGALVAGFTFMVSVYEVGGLHHLQSLCAAFLPIILLGTEEFAATGRRRWAAIAAAALSLQILSGSYIAFWGMATWASATCVAVVARQLPKPSPQRLGRDATLLVTAAVAAAISVLPVVIPYLSLLGEGGIPSARGDLISLVPRLIQYLRGPESVALATSVVLLAALGGYGLAREGWRGRTRLALVVAVALTGVVVSLGPTPIGTPLYDFVAEVIPGFGSIRDPARAALLPHLSASVLAGCGVGTLLRLLPRAGVIVAAALTLSFAFARIDLDVPLRKLPTERDLPAGIEYLARCGAGDPLLEVPAPARTMSYHEAEVMYLSTYHWLPLLNGRVSYSAPLMKNALDRSRRLPDPKSVSWLRRHTGVRWIRADCASESWVRWSRERLCGEHGIRGARRYDLGSVILYDLGPVDQLPREMPRRWSPPEDCADGPRSHTVSSAGAVE